MIGTLTEEIANVKIGITDQMIGIMKYIATVSYSMISAESVRWSLEEKGKNRTSTKLMEIKKVLV